jgi:hypothetical protein
MLGVNTQEKVEVVNVLLNLLTLVVTAVLPILVLGLRRYIAAYMTNIERAQERTRRELGELKQSTSVLSQRLPSSGRVNKTTGRPYARRSSERPSRDAE